MATRLRFLEAHRSLQPLKVIWSFVVFLSFHQALMTSAQDTTSQDDVQTDLNLSPPTRLKGKAFENRQEHGSHQKRLMHEDRNGAPSNFDPGKFHLSSNDVVPTRRLNSPSRDNGVVQFSQQNFMRFPPHRSGSRSGRRGSGILQSESSVTGKTSSMTRRQSSYYGEQSNAKTISEDKNQRLEAQRSLLEDQERDSKYQNSTLNTGDILDSQRSKLKDQGDSSQYDFESNKTVNQDVKQDEEESEGDIRESRQILDGLPEDEVFSNTNTHSSGALRRGQWDRSLCPPCNCSSNSSNWKYANCTHNHLFRMPMGLPRDLRALNISSNYITFFNGQNTTMYPNMSILDLSNNRVKHIINSPRLPLKSGLVYLSLKGNDITDLRTITFNIFPNLQSLTLSSNRISYIPSSVFEGCTQLVVLDLSHNIIKEIDSSSFDYLTNLLHLHLNNNPNLGYDRQFFTQRLFQGLHKLQSLYIQCSSHGDYAYPNEALANLANLRILYIDGLHDGVEFGPQFKRLYRLRTISFSYSCRSCFFGNISSTFFDNLQSIRSVSFNRCSFRHIDPRAFAVLPRLETYTISDPGKYTLTQAFKDLVGLTGTSLKRLALKGFHHNPMPCNALSSIEGQHIRNFTLEELDLSNNELVFLRNDFLVDIPKTLKRLVLHDNRFTMKAIMWTHLPFLPELFELDVRNQNMENPHNVDDTARKDGSPPESDHRDGSEDDQSSDTEMGRCILACESDPSISNQKDGQSQRVDKERYKQDMPKAMPDESYNKSQVGRLSMTKERLNRFVIQLPPKLTIIRSSNYLFFGRVLFTHELISKSLRQIFFSNGFLSNWGNGRMPRILEFADLSNNFCDTLSSSFFPKDNALKYLFIQKNNLGPVLATDTDGNIFATLNKLVYLNMARNSIFHLPRKFLRGLSTLKTLVLMDNKLQVIDFDFSYSPELSFLDLSKNSITLLSKASRDKMDDIASHHTLKIDLTDNPLSCTCAGMEQLQWILSSKVDIVSHSLLKCFDGSKMEDLKDVQSKVNELSRQCASTKYIIIGGSLAGVMFLTFVGLALLYRHRWKLMYAKNVWLVNLYGFRPMKRTSSGCLYDAYVVYSEQDSHFVVGVLLKELEEKRGHRLCVGDRNFMPGSLVFNDITCAITNSTVTLLVLSPDFLADKELEYATQMALMEEYNSQNKRDVILLLNLKKTNAMEMSKDLLMLMKNGRFLDYPLVNGKKEEEEDGGARVPNVTLQDFWDRLSSEIGRTDNRNTSHFMTTT